MAFFDGCFPYNDVIGQLLDICRNGSNTFLSPDTMHFELKLRAQTTQKVPSEFFFTEISQAQWFREKVINKILTCIFISLGTNFRALL